MELRAVVWRVAMFQAFAHILPGLSSTFPGSMSPKAQRTRIANLPPHPSSHPPPKRQQAAAVQSAPRGVGSATSPYPFITFR